ncbi:hypothetical protein AAIG11_09095 [Anoxynatronum sibiricum]|uniref:Uncharacterized protein n=2 Tax=Anoxynatronum sibiricum TaxID=210623 RepID=A0ABU9VTY9_9CLOT
MDLQLVNGHLVTMDPKLPRAEAVALKNGRKRGELQKTINTDVILILVGSASASFDKRRKAPSAKGCWLT